MLGKKYTKEPVCCPCGREATGMGYTPRQGAPIAWVCEGCKNTEIGRVHFNMSAKELSFHEAVALSDAGDAAGEYLESLGKTDLGSLDREEWLKFLKTVLTAYSEKMKERLLSHAAPF